MKKLFPDGMSLLIMAAIEKEGSANVVQIRDSMFAAVGVSPPMGNIHGYLDTMVREDLATKTKGPGQAASDIFELTSKGRSEFERFCDGIKTLCPGHPEKQTGEAA